MCYNKTMSTTDIKTIRRAERAARAAADPWFGRRRSAGEMGRTKTKAERSRRQARGRSYRGSAD